MADNYLEKKMDDYRRGITSKVSRRSSSTSAGNGAVEIKPGRIGLLIGDVQLLQAALTVLQRIAGLKIAFVGTDYREGRRLAQASGSLFVPVSSLGVAAHQPLLDAAAGRWGGLDLVVTDFPDDIPSASRIVLEYPLSSLRLQVSEQSDSAVLRVKIPSADYPVSNIAGLLPILLTSPAASLSTVVLR